MIFANFPVHVVGLIISYLDRCEGTYSAIPFTEGMSPVEKRIITKMWLDSSKIECEEEFVGGYNPHDLSVKTWTMNGKHHREGDKPASIYSDGSKAWYKNGLRHRNGDRPAAVSNERKAWYCHGKLHRGGGRPAVQGHLREEWWVDGLKHRDEKDEKGYVLPAYITNETVQWWVHGKQHRKERDDKGNELPAIISHNLKEWWVDGKKHRDDGPAVVRQNAVPGYPPSEEWWKNGLQHREELDENGNDLPAEITMHRFAWYQNGQVHRDGDKPALVHRDGGTREWYQHGMCHRETLDEKGLVNPAVIFSDGSKRWKRNGMYHRDDDLPAVTHGGIEWWVDGVRYCNSGQEWWKNGVRHRDGGNPAVISLSYMEWYEYGKLIRETHEGSESEPDDEPDDDWEGNRRPDFAEI